MATTPDPFMQTQRMADKRPPKLCCIGRPVTGSKQRRGGGRALVAHDRTAAMLTSNWVSRMPGSCAR